MSNPVGQWVGARLRAYPGREALASAEGAVSYAELGARVEGWRERLRGWGIARGAVVGFRGDYSPATVSLLLAVLASRRVALPLGAGPDWERLLSLAHADALVDAEGGTWEALARPEPVPPLLGALRDRGQAGLVVFSSGSSGPPKAALYDAAVLASRYRRGARALRTLVFLLIDHFGGINTVLHTLSAGGTAVLCGGRAAADVCRRIESQRVEMLPTTPTFLRMLLISRRHERHDLSSLALVTYGTEPMPAQTLRALSAALPGVRLKQTYGLTELGVLPTRSRASDSRWLAVGGVGCEARVEDGVLWLRSETPMLGYLNAPSPFDDQGWYCTGDRVEVDGGFVRIVGRESDVINVGGEKVYPSAVEEALLGVDNVAEAVVWGERNAVTGQVVRARVSLVRPEPAAGAAERIRRACARRLPRHQVPVYVDVVEDGLHGPRHKKRRPSAAAPPAS